MLYERHGADCYRLARHITASGALAEDAVQEAFVGLWRTPGAYQRGRGTVRNWLLALTHHKAVDLVRRETAEQRRQDAGAVQEAVDLARGEDPAAAAWSRIQAAEVRAALRDLPEAQRQALTLAYFGGYTQTQIAELTGVPLGTVKTRMFTAMRRLRLRLRSAGRQPPPRRDHDDGAERGSTIAMTSWLPDTRWTPWTRRTSRSSPATWRTAGAARTRSRATWRVTAALADSSPRADARPAERAAARPHHGRGLGRDWHRRRPACPAGRPSPRCPG